ncbi:ABC transporter permease [Algoriphagus hitonicola]|uniref:Putative ABC transport system permease protein n=1 Tax=Algoriphagus hitonicola TaxID=435880 RepID=A0A1I2SZZ6_9BACT|nr:ABC transporter permease [Algoriphagus hitonicola]SFG58193.1 putative ABC transport system permease protein [Algoriphagus hitonicola]
MLRNYLKIAYRNLVKNKTYTSINIFGLTLGFVCCILIILFVRDEFSYDQFIPEEDRIFRVALERIYPDHTSFYAVIPDGYSDVFAEEIIGVEESTRIFGLGNTFVIDIDDQRFDERYGAAADSNFFNVFDFEILHGASQQEALAKPNTAVLTQSAARRLFKSENPVGKSFDVFGLDFEVSAVMADLPENSHLQLDFLFASVSFPGLEGENFTGFSAFTYLKINPEINALQVENQIPELVNKYASGQIERELGVSFADYTTAGNGYRYFLQPITSIHLHSNLEGEMKPNGNSLYVYIFISIAIFILVLACINFINLATARSADRAREVGVRKAMGSDRSQIILQFLFEALILTFISLLLGILLVNLALPFFNDLAEKSLRIELESVLYALPFLIGFGFLVGLLAGYYPAFHISKLNTISILKGKLEVSGGRNWLRNGLVVFQFAIAIMLIAGTLIIQGQVKFIQSTSLGFQKENVLVVERYGNQEKREFIKEELAKIPGVISAGVSSSLPGRGTTGIQFTKPGGGDVLTAKSFAVDDYFFQTIGIPPLEGRVFNENFNDSLSLILNREAGKVFFGDQDPIGQRLKTNTNLDGQNQELQLTIIGVVDNFNFESLHTQVTPLVILHVENPIGNENFLSLKFDSGQQAALVEALESKWNQLSDGSNLSYFFLDNDLVQLYRSEQVSGQILGVFSILAIVIACIGLFGLAAYTAFLKTKEIGVRKVLGATVGSIVFLLTLEFAKLVGIAFLFAIPVVWFAMDSWLESFAFRVPMNPLVFLAAGGITLSIALLTVSYQAISAALVNPVKSLKSE